MRLLLSPIRMGWPHGGAHTNHRVHEWIFFIKKCKIREGTWGRIDKARANHVMAYAEVANARLKVQGTHPMERVTEDLQKRCEQEYIGGWLVRRGAMKGIYFFKKLVGIFFIFLDEKNTTRIL